MTLTTASGYGPPAALAISSLVSGSGIAAPGFSAHSIAALSSGPPVKTLATATTKNCPAVASPNAAVPALPNLRGSIRIERDDANSKDVSDEEWAFVAPYLVLMKEDAPQRQYGLREVFDGLRTRCGLARRGV